AASILPALAFTLAMVPLLLPMVPRFHETRILKGTAIVLLTLAMPIAFGRSLDRRSVAHDLESAAQDLEALHPELLDTPIWTSQAGHFAYLHAGPVLDPVRQAQGLPEEERVLTRLVQTAGPILLLISEQELAENRFAGLTSVWTTEADHDWWNQHTTRVERYGDWHLIAAKP
ncbi:MAG: hypothetical protein R3E96_09850, partial [Planctomycetota bacterium]